MFSVLQKQLQPNRADSSRTLWSDRLIPLSVAGRFTSIRRQMHNVINIEKETKTSWDLKINAKCLNKRVSHCLHCVIYIYIYQWVCEYMYCMSIFFVLHHLLLFIFQISGDRRDKAHFRTHTIIPYDQVVKYRGFDTNMTFGIYLSSTNLSYRSNVNITLRKVGKAKKFNENLSTEHCYLQNIFFTLSLFPR